ncbi:MAG: hypothetical protein KHX56_03285 [Clostridiales bacterium]|nr:hypothetical protein [Clostridiales bacterium]
MKMRFKKNKISAWVFTALFAASCAIQTAPAFAAPNRGAGSAAAAAVQAPATVQAPERLPSEYSYPVAFGASVWENSYFSIDGEHLYDKMSVPANNEGIFTIEKGMTVYIPFTYLPADSAVTGDLVQVTLELSQEAAVNVNTLRYELTAKRTVSRTDRTAEAYLIEWHPDIKSQMIPLTVRARVHIKGSIAGPGGSQALETDGSIELRFKASKDPEETEGTEETKESDTSQTQETTIPGGHESNETESDETGESETGDIPPESETNDTGAPGDDEPDTNEPDTTDPDINEPDTTEPGNENPDDKNPDGQIGDGSMGPVTDSPVTWGGGSGGGGSSGGESPTAPAKLRILDCTVDSEEIHPGDVVNIKVTLKNSSSQTAVKDIRIVYESATGELLPVNATNSIYVDSMSAGGTYTIEFPIEVGYTLTSDSQKMTLTMEFTDKDAASLTSTENIFLKITPSFALKVDQPSMAASVESGSSQDITVNVYNTGGSVVKNVICSLTMDGVTAAGSAFGGDVAAGESASIVLHTLVGKLSGSSAEGTGGGSGSSAGGTDGGSGSSAGGTDGGSGSSAEGTGGGSGSSTASTGGSSGNGYGQTTGTVLVQYEDEEGNEYSEQVLVTTQIVPPEGEAIEEKNVEKSSQWWVSIVCGLVAIQIVIFILIGVHRRRNI